MIAIIDYGSGNVNAIGNIYKSLSIDHVISSDPLIISQADKLILPGVGAFDQTMGQINESGLREVLDRKVLQDNIPILGICVGMQILGNCSEEGHLNGLGWIDGVVKKFDVKKINTVPKLPHMGWNNIELVKKSELFENVDYEQGFYFLHSYYFECNEKENILAASYYSKNFTCAVKNNNVFGVQFHPEKSHSNGVSLLQNFSKLVC